MNKLILEKETVVNKKQNLTLRRAEVQNFLLSLEMIKPENKNKFKT